MENAADFDGVRSDNKKEPVVSDAETEFIPLLKCLDVAFAGLGKAMQGVQDPHRRWFVEAANIGLRGLGPNDRPHGAS